MDDETDRALLGKINALAREEQRLYARDWLSDRDRIRLKQIGTVLNQYWDLLRQRDALREFGKNPNDARIRPASIVERFIG